MSVLVAFKRGLAVGLPRADSVLVGAHEAVSVRFFSEQEGKGVAAVAKLDVASAFNAEISFASVVRHSDRGDIVPPRLVGVIGRRRNADEVAVLTIPGRIDIGTGDPVPGRRGEVVDVDRLPLSTK